MPKFEFIKNVIYQNDEFNKLINFEFLFKL